MSSSYTARSAYLIQCHGTYSRFHTKTLWQAKAEGKMKLHLWLSLHNGPLTADNLLKRNWPCNPQCPLCDQEQKTVDHISIYCVIARQVWHEVNNWANIHILNNEDVGKSLLTWWNEKMEKFTGNMRKKAATLIVYTVWNIWKERNRIIFQHTSLQPNQIV